LHEGLLPDFGSSDSVLSPEGRCILEAIDSLPEEEREAFDLVRSQGLTLGEAADVLVVSIKTVQRRLDRGLRLLTSCLADFVPRAMRSVLPEPIPGRQASQHWAGNGA
jgi:RNA polymerase sigma-70 factor (ECF subfamily)